MTCPATEPSSTAAHFRRISRADFAAMWADVSITRREIAVIVGLSEKGVSCRAKAYGLALRGHKTRRPDVKDIALFSDMWRAGVSTEEIARHFNVARRTVENTKVRLGLDARNKGRRPLITLTGFIEGRLSRRMAITAKAEQQQLLLAEMVDHRRTSSGRAAA